MNQFGSGKDGHGKACKNMRKLYIMRPEDMLPIVLTLPPTAIRAYDHYKERLFLKRHGTPPQTDSPTEHNPPSAGGDYIEIDADMLPGLDAAK